jgi:branched-chain amino acid transport system substrate-binding protein
MAQAAGFQEQAFLTAAGPLAEGVFSRSSFALDASKSRPAIPIVNGMFRAKADKDLNDNTARQVTAVQILADAINRAGSTKPDDIHKALEETSVPGDQTIMPWKGVKFDETGQNIWATPVIQQVFGGVYKTVYPFDVATTQAVWNVGK